MKLEDHVDTLQTFLRVAQGGLEHPCCIIFVGHADKIRKISKLLKEAPTCELTGVSEPPAKKSKIDIVDSPKDSENTHPTWIQKHGYRLSLLNKEVLYSGDMLSDLHMDVSQAILKNQFPHVDGFNNTLLQVKQSSELEIKSGLQIVHCRGNHWILASNMSCEEGVVQLFDSIFASVDETTVRVLHTFFQFTNIQMMPFQKQLGCFRLWIIFYCSSNGNSVWSRSYNYLFPARQNAEPPTKLY